MNHPQHASNDTQGPPLVMAWLPATIGVLVICMESTKTMSAAHTGQWLLTVCHWLWGQTATPALETANFVLRKLGHFCGYGILALLFRRGWYYTLMQSGVRSRLPFSSGALGVICTFVVACADELHQSFLPGRTSSFHDVLIDTTGAIVFNVGFWIFLSRRTPVEHSVPLGV
jgi:VanZ family protein